MQKKSEKHLETFFHSMPLEGVNNVLIWKISGIIEYVVLLNWNKIKQNTSMKSWNLTFLL